MPATGDDPHQPGTASTSFESPQLGFVAAGSLCHWPLSRPWWLPVTAGTIVPNGRLLLSHTSGLSGGRTTMAKASKTLEILFHDTLKDIYFAEKKILKTLPKLTKAARNSALRTAFQKHIRETEGHVERLEQVFAMIDKKPQAKTCDAIVGLADEGAAIMAEYKESPALDAGLLAAAQAVEHYEISRYGTLRTWANELGLRKAAALFERTLKEEEATDDALTKIAEAVVNQEAQKAAE
jgi:ferritin-like metal-binding protein YciE